MSESTQDAATVAGAASAEYVVTARGFGYAPGTKLTADEAEAARKAGTLGVFTVRTMKGS